ncbi:MAG: type I restriction-modification system subunit M [bacterium]
MAIKKSELYSSLWAGCDELRGSMDASQYKDYVLVLLFMKYVSDKGGELVDIPARGSFKDMVKLKGQPDIGDKINKIIGELAKANDLTGVITVADFNDDEKLGKGKDKVDRLSNLIEIFEKPELDFSSNRAEGDDILGDAYEYLMRHFATESGKSKGQFYTPAEVSRIMAKVIGINPQNTSGQTTVYDPTCGSGSLLLKVADEAGKSISIYGQENDNATRALAVMNMWLHGNPAIEIVQGNTLSAPQFTDDVTGEIKQFDYAVSNPPFSHKAWTTGWDPGHDIYKRFTGYDSLPPKKNGDFAFLLHLIKSLKSKGKGCIVMPLGVLFRGNTEAVIRKKMIQRGYIKGIIGLPPNLFYGTGIAACLVVIDKENAENRQDIFMIDAGKSFIKDGNKNRLREQDIHKIVDTFNNRIEIPSYSRIIPVSEIADPKNDYNLNIPRYIDSQEMEDVQDIEAHLLGGIPNRDIDDLGTYWEVYPTLRSTLFKPSKRANYSALCIAKEEIKNTIFHHPEFTAFSKQMGAVFNKWKTKTSNYAKALDKGLHPKQEIFVISESLLKVYVNKNLIDKYDVYQHLMDYWAETMQDDMYELTADGWKAGNEVKRIEKKTQKGGKEVVKHVAGIEGLEGRLIPPAFLIQEYFAAEQKAIDDLQAQAETLNAEMDEMREEHGGEEGVLANAIDDKGKITKGNLQKAIKELGTRNADNAEEYDMLHAYKKRMDDETKIKAEIKKATADLEILIIKKYPSLSMDDIKTIVVDKKWLHSIEQRIRTELDNISHRLTQRIKELAERYETPLPRQIDAVKDMEEKVNTHLQKMGFVWK